jgi:hypothetical protein
MSTDFSGTKFAIPAFRFVILRVCSVNILFASLDCVYFLHLDINVFFVPSQNWSVNGEHIPFILYVLVGLLGYFFCWITNT